MYAKFLKRFFDLLLSLTAFIILLPLLILLTIVGTIAMKGNPFFVQKRPGMRDKKSGKERIINLLKFRTMSNEKDSNGNLLPDDVRLNTYGKILRRTSLDELPSLLNIIVGDIAIIGPRPLLVNYLEYYNDFERRRHNVRPGLTGYAQVNGRNTLSWKQKFELDIYYVDNISIFLDIKILFMTVLKVTKQEGINFSKNHQTIYEYFSSDDRVVSDKNIVSNV